MKEVGFINLMPLYLSSVENNFLHPLFPISFTVEKALQSLDDPREAVLALGLLRGLLQRWGENTFLFVCNTQIYRQIIAGFYFFKLFPRLTSVEDWYSILHQKSILMAICSHCHHSLKSCSNPEVVQASLGLLLTVSKSPQGCQGLLAVDLSQMVCFLLKIHIIHTIILDYFTTRTTDARWGNLLHCTAKKEIPIQSYIHQVL